ncbi:MAG: peptidylprolyl isomerase [SAR324 cluster bacterium]|nr:peptidylprolyl isomerase [SAR324 cluster bacterium]
MKIEKNKVASIDYTLKDNNGEVMDTSEGGEPLAYIHGIGNLIPGLENELEGKKEGDSFKITIEPGDAYGFRDDELTQVAPRSAFEGVEEPLEVGMQFRVQAEEGEQIATVVDIDGDNITLDANHPMAGETLNFDVSIVSIREATEEELEHGHPHGPGGTHH